MIPIDDQTPLDEVRTSVEEWVARTLPVAWREAAAKGPEAIRAVRSSDEYEAWYPAFAASGLVVPTWDRRYGGLGLDRERAAAVDRVLAPYRLRRLNPLGLNNAAAALFAHGTEEQRLRFLPPMVRNEERWCQLFSEPGAGSDLASLACRAERDGDEWVVTGQKVWTTWATDADFAILLARTNPTQPKNRGITYLLLDLDQPGVEIRPLRQLTGETEFNEVWLDAARVPDAHRVGAIDDGWKVSASTLSSERQMVSGGSQGSGMGRLGGVGADRAIELAREMGRSREPTVRQTLARLWAEEQVRGWTNQRVRASVSAGQSAGPAASIGKVHQAVINQQLQAAVVDLLGAGGTAWEQVGLRPEVRGMLRSRANSIEGGTTEINKNILGERVLGLPREPDPWRGRPWNEVPRS